MTHDEPSHQDLLCLPAVNDFEKKKKTVDMTNTKMEEFT